MKTVYAIQHHTTKRYLTLPPTLGVHDSTLDEARAHVYEFQTIAIAEHTALGAFQGAYEVVTLTRPSGDVL